MSKNTPPKFTTFFLLFGKGIISALRLLHGPLSYGWLDFTEETSVSWTVSTFRAVVGCCKLLCPGTSFN